MWADAITWSRVMSFSSAAPIDSTSFNFDDDMHIVPFIDFANHASTPNACWQISAHNDESASVELVITAPVAPGEEITISYGDKPNVEFLFLHGFALADNPLNTIAIPLPMIEYDMMMGDGQDKVADETLRSVAETSLIVKKQLLRMLRLPAMIVIGGPMQNDQDPTVPHTDHGSEDVDPASRDTSKQEKDACLPTPTRGAMSSDALLAMYIAVLGADEDLCLDNKYSDATSNSPPMFRIGDRVLESINKSTVSRALQELPIAEVLALRVWSIMIQLIDYHGGELMEHYTADSHTSNNSSTKETSTPNDFLAHLDIVRHGQIESLDRALAVFTKLQQSYATLPGVTAFLQKMQMRD